MFDFFRRRWSSIPERYNNNFENRLYYLACADPLVMLAIGVAVFFGTLSLLMMAGCAPVAPEATPQAVEIEEQVTYPEFWDPDGGSFCRGWNEVMQFSAEGDAPEEMPKVQTQDLDEFLLMVDKCNDSGYAITHYDNGVVIATYVDSSTQYPILLGVVEQNR